MKRKTGGRKVKLIPCPWCGTGQPTGQLMAHLKVCAGQPDASPSATWLVYADWMELTDKVEDLVRQIPDLRGRYSMRTKKDELLNAIWDVVEFAEKYSRQSAELVQKATGHGITVLGPWPTASKLEGKYG